MSVRLAVGTALFVGGAVVWRLAHSGRIRGPAWLPRFGIGLAALGLGTLALTQPGLWWSVGSIVFGAIAVGMLAAVVIENVRR